MARRHAAQLEFFTPIAPAADYVADVAAARAVLRAQLGDGTAIRELYLGWFDLVAGFCRVALPTTTAADEATQDILCEAIDMLGGLDPLATPFRVFLFSLALDVVEVRRDEELGGHDGLHGHGEINDEAVASALKWVRDHEISFLIGRLPSPQREVLLLRHIARLTEGQAAALLDLELECARALQVDALDRLRETLAALGRGAPSTHREAMRRLSRPSTVLVRRRQALLTG
jgi:DNA-directed RNA polymerase specialized sigma24 family protein